MLFSTGAPLKADPSKFDSNAPSDSGLKEEHTVPWIAALTTYFGYAVLILFGEIFTKNNNRIDFPEICVMVPC